MGLVARQGVMFKDKLTCRKNNIQPDNLKNVKKRTDGLFAMRRRGEADPGTWRGF